MNKALKALETLRQNFKDDSHAFDDELLDIVESTLKRSICWGFKTNIEKIKDFRYLVYKRTEKGIKKFTICKDYPIAVYIASLLAFHDNEYEEYRLTLIDLEENPNYFCPGGGYCECFIKSKITRNIERYTIS